MYNEEKMVQKVASFEYEYDDGDQNWSDVTTYYKNTDGTFVKKYKEGYYGNTSIVSVTEEEIINKMNEIRLKVQKRKEERALYGYSQERKQIMPIIDTQNNQYSKNVYRNMFFTSFEEFLVGTAPSMLETLIVLVMILPFILVGMNNFGINIGFDFIVRCFSTVNVAAAYIGTLSGILFLSRSIRYVKYVRKNVAII